jgi:hypothetical protein
MLQTGTWLSTHFLDWFGKIAGEKIKVVFGRGGTYARPGFVVLKQDSQEDYQSNFYDYFLFVSHEFAHLWWSRAPTSTRDAWLDETFAGYSAWMAIRDKLGKNCFKK